MFPMTDPKAKSRIEADTDTQATINEQARTIAAQARRITILKSELEQVVNCAEPCANCDETGNDPGTLDACGVCGGYGFNVKGDIREVVISIRKVLAER